MICKQLLLLFFVACLFVPACIKCDDLLYDIFSSFHDFCIAKQIDRLVSCLVKHTICDYMIIIITLPSLKPMPVMHVGALTARYVPKSITTWTPNDRHCTQPFRNKNIKFWYFFFDQYRKCALECQCCWNGTSHQIYAHRNRSLCRQCECLQCEKKTNFWYAYENLNFFFFRFVSCGA